MPYLKIKYHNVDLLPLGYMGQNKSDWIDLRSAENVTLKAGQTYCLSLGVSIALPEGYEAHVVPRSSTFKTWGIIQTNCMGVIDESYCGDADIWHMPILATRDTEIKINDRVCQFRICRHQDPVSFEEVKHLDGENRGGFGSTGTN